MAQPANKEPPKLKPPSRFSAFLIGCAALVGTSLIAMAEIDRLIAGVVAAGGRTATVAELVGPLALGEKARGVWQTWVAAGPTAEAGRLPEFIGWNVGWDLVFAVALAALVAGTLLLDVGFREPTFRLLLGYVAVELIEGLLLAVAASLIAPDGPPAAIQVVLALASTAKWAIVACLVLAVLRRPDLRRRLGKRGTADGRGAVGPTPVLRPGGRPRAADPRPGREHPRPAT